MGIRSWYGQVNQVLFAKSDLMQPFHNLLKKYSEYTFNDDLEKAFDTAKIEIVELIKTGEKSFHLGVWTCLVTNWRRTVDGIDLFWGCSA